MPLLDSLHDVARAAMKRAQRGLFGGKQITFGFSRSKSEAKRPRIWKPNVQKKSLYSQLLDIKLKFKLTTSVLRTIDKMGGLDRYLLYTQPKYIDSQLGLKVRNKLMRVFKEKNGFPFDYKNKDLLKPLGYYEPGSYIYTPPENIPIPSSSPPTSEDQHAAVDSSSLNLTSDITTTTENSKNGEDKQFMEEKK